MAGRGVGRRDDLGKLLLDEIYNHLILTDTQAYVDKLLERGVRLTGFGASTWMV